MVDLNSLSKSKEQTRRGPTMNFWKGVIIEEGLEEKTILSMVKIVRTDLEKLESEEDVGELHFHKVEIDDKQLESFIELSMKNLLDSWYIHLVKDGVMKVIFRNKVFEATKGDTQQFNNIKRYALSQGILEEQIEVERLIDNPYDEGRID